MRESIDIFLSSAPEDDALRDQLEKQLRNWERQGLITVWHAHHVSAGTQWAREIDLHLNRAQLILLLISPDFMQSEQCYGQMQRALERQAAGEARVVPILLRPMYWQDAPFSALRALPRNDIPLTAWRDPDEALLDIMTALEGVIKEMISLPPVVSMRTVEPPLVFLSYSRTDEAFVTRLKADLQAQGVTAWIERKGIRPGNVGREEALRTAIRKARAIVLVVSPATRTSRTVKEELRIAEVYQRIVYPLWIAGEAWRDVVPLSLAGTASIDVRQERYPQAVHDLVTMLTRDTVLPRTELSASPHPALPANPPRNPYKGLQAFRGEDAHDFFGRSQLIEELVEAVRGGLPSEPPQDTIITPRLLTILGASGSGKSSVVMAGLLPQLQQGRLPGSQEWLYLEPMVPGEHPIEALALTLSEHFPARSLTSIREDLEDESSRGLHLLMASLLKRAHAHSVLLVDQFEEVFTQTESEEERRRFLDLLITASTEPHGPLIVLLTLRADFYDRPLRYPEVARLLEAHHILVLPMELQGLREVIEKPAQLPEVQLTFENDLIGDMLFDVHGQVGALPLLEFTLDQLFQRREDHHLTRQAYRELGGVKGALAKHAEATYLSLLSDNHRRLAHALFVRLIDVGAVGQDATRRRAALSELTLLDADETTKLSEVMTTFTKARLLTTTTSAGVATMELSHEAIIKEWTRLTLWLQEAGEDIRLQKVISEDAAEWIRHGKPVDRLYRGTQLAEAQAWSTRNIPSRDEADFLQSSFREKWKQRRYTRRTFLVIGVASVGLSLGTFAVSRLLFSTSAPPPSFPTLLAQKLPYTYPGHTRSVYSVAWAPDGKLLASAGADRTVQVWQASTGYRLLTYKGHTESVLSVAWAPDGKLLASAGNDTTVQVWPLIES